MNGGPGCTSLKGGFEELGQLVFNRHSFMQNTTAVYISTTKPARRLVTVDRDMAVSERVALRMPAACCLLLAFRHQKCTAIPSLGRNYPRCCTSSHHLAWDFPTCDCVATDVSTAEDNYDALVSFFEGAH
jgi:hypothetical protein